MMIKMRLLFFILDVLNEENKNIFDEKYTKNKNPFKHYIYFDKNKIRVLNAMAFQKSTDDVFVKEYNNNIEDGHFYHNEKYMNDNSNIKIGNESFDRDKQFDIITNKILENCNILKHKSKMNNT